MNIYKISQKENTGYDTYDAAIVSAPDEEAARRMSPRYGEDEFDFTRATNALYADWATKPKRVKVEYLGTYHKEVSELILASFNAG